MPKNDDDRGAMARDAQRVRAALEDLANLAGNRRHRRRGAAPAPRANAANSPSHYVPPPMSSPADSAPLSTPDLFFAEFDAGAEQFGDRAKAIPELSDSTPLSPADQDSWFTDPGDSPATVSSLRHSPDSEYRTFRDEVAIVTPTGQQDTQDAPRMESAPERPSPSAPPGESIDDVLDGFNW